jgi:hypothetical protein
VNGLVGIYNSMAAANRKLKNKRKCQHSATIFITLWKIHFVLAANAWLWSSVFHCRDTKTTEKYDYFSAGALVAFNLFLSIARVLELSSPLALTALGLPILGVYLVHVHRMVTVLFDYGFHVTLCIAAGAIQSLVWLVWAVATGKGKSHPGRRLLLLFMVSVNVAMLLEVLDFPPLMKIVDAHALWHVVTVPLTVLLWNRFVGRDVLYLLINSDDAYKK